MQIIRQTGLTGFTGAINTTAPNATVNIANLLANVISTDGDVVITPKGAGAFILGRFPNNLTSGGNKRGQYAVDLQLNRTSAEQVASGSYSTAMGFGNVASGAFSFAQGNLCASNGSYSFAQGNQTVASQNYSYAFGFYTISNVRGKIAFSAGREAVNGDNQTTLLRLFNRSSSSAVTSLTSESSPTRFATNILILNNNSSFLIEALVTGRTANGAKQIALKLTALAERGATASTTALVGNQVKSIIANKGSVTWDANLVADTTNGGVYIAVTGEDATDIQWSATLVVDENTF